MRYIWKILATCGVVGMIMAAFVQPAVAAYGSYAVSQSAEIRQTINSGLLSTVNGGRVSTTSSVGVDAWLHAENYSAPPGGVVYGSGSGTAPGWVYYSHAQQSNIYARCWWDMDYNIGPLNLSCDYRY